MGLSCHEDHGGRNISDCAMTPQCEESIFEKSRHINKKEIGTFSLGFFCYYYLKPFGGNNKQK